MFALRGADPDKHVVLRVWYGSDELQRVWRGHSVSMFDPLHGTEPSASGSGNGRWDRECCWSVWESVRTCDRRCSRDSRQPKCTGSWKQRERCTIAELQSSGVSELRIRRRRNDCRRRCILRSWCCRTQEMNQQQHQDHRHQDHRHQDHRHQDHRVISFIRLLFRKQLSKARKHNAPVVQWLGRDNAGCPRKPSHIRLTLGSSKPGCLHPIESVTNTASR